MNGALEIPTCRCGAPMGEIRKTGHFKCANCDAIQPQEYCGCMVESDCTHDKKRVPTTQDLQSNRALEKSMTKWYAKR